MVRRFVILSMFVTLLTVSAVASVVHDTDMTFIDRLEIAVADGQLDQEQALLYAFFYGFDHDALPEAWRPESFPPLKCGTALMQNYEELRPTLSSETIKRIDGYLTPLPSENKATYLSPLGHYNLTYLTTGGNAVPATDVNPANGVPDYVERCAEYLDTSWETEIVSMGFTAPPSHPYPISFENMSYYGYTTVISGTATRIVLHNTFVGFPPNDDPDGDVLGAAKVTCAHEFKHASQRAQSGWSEGGWVELDATWMEDIVFDQVNDYYNYLPSGCGITSPQLSLNNGGSGSYEDCIWQLWMSETYTTQIIIDFWNWRSSHTGEPVLNSYNSILGSYGDSLADGYASFAAWNVVTGTRTLGATGYGEASGYPTGPVTGIGVYPNVQSGTTAALAAKNFYCAGFTGLTGTLDIQFNGQNGSSMALMAVTKKTDGSGVIERVTLDANNDATASLSTPIESMIWTCLVVVNTGTSASASWDMTVDRNEILPIPAIQLSANSVLHTQNINESGLEFVTVSNPGDVGSVLNFTGMVMDIDPTAVLKSGSSRPLSAARIDRAAPDLQRTPGEASPSADRYVGDCVYGNNDTANIQGQYTTWWAGNESYAVKIDPAAAACSCAAGFNVRAVHMILYLGTTSTPQVRVQLAADAGGCSGPGAVIDTSAPITVVAQAAAGYYDIEVPCDFTCTDVGAGPYYLVFEFLNAAGPVGIAVDTTPTSCFNFNLWDASGYQELVDGYGFAGDLLIWADVDCCGAAVPEVSVVAPDGGEFLAVGSVETLSWTATVLADVKIELSRDSGSTWEVLFASTTNDGSEPWTVAGASSTHCLLRVGSVDGSVQDVSNAEFVIHGTVPWLFVVPITPVAVPQGTTYEFMLGFDTNGMTPGFYDGFVVLDNDAPTGPEVIAVTLEVVDPGTPVGDAPPVFRIQGNHPNPFNPATTIRFSLTEAGPAIVDVIDLQGRVVRTLHRGELPAGQTGLQWDGRDDVGRQVGSGTYVARVRSGGSSVSHKMVLSK